MTSCSISLLDQPTLPTRHQPSCRRLQHRPNVCVRVWEQCSEACARDRHGRVAWRAMVRGRLRVPLTAPQGSQDPTLRDAALAPCAGSTDAVGARAHAAHGAGALPHAAQLPVRHLSPLPQLGTQGAAATPESGPGGLTREVETPLHSNHPRCGQMMPFQLNTTSCSGETDTSPRLVPEGGGGGGRRRSGCSGRWPRCSASASSRTCLASCRT